MSRGHLYRLMDTDEKWQPLRKAWTVSGGKPTRELSRVTARAAVAAGDR